MSDKPKKAAVKGRIDHSNYNDGYDPRAVEYDLVTIKQLMRGKKRLTMQLSREIYYKLKLENIQFKSEKGAEFLEKLSQNMTAAQMQEIDKMVADKKRRAYTRKQLLRLNRRIAVGMFAAVLILCVIFLNWNLLLDIRTNYETKKLQEKIEKQEEMAESQGGLGEAAADINVQPHVDTAGAEPLLAGEESSPAVLNKFKLLYEENPDFAGWLTIDGTRIDYPVMSKEGDNDYYLDKNFAQQEDKNGLLILDYRCDVLSDMQNIIIYGHNMRTGVMFGTLSKYKDKSFCEEHPTIHFDNLYEENEYEVVAAVLSEVAYEDEEVFRYYDAIDISTEESFNAFRENIYENAIYTMGEELKFGDSCLILSTCDNYTEDGRFVVVARKL